MSVVCCSTPSGGLLDRKGQRFDEAAAKRTLERYLADFKRRGGPPLKVETFGPVFPEGGNKVRVSLTVRYSTGGQLVPNSSAVFQRSQDGKWYLVSAVSFSVTPPMPVEGGMPTEGPARGQTPDKVGANGRPALP